MLSEPLQFFSRTVNEIAVGSPGLRDRLAKIWTELDHVRPEHISDDETRRECEELIAQLRRCGSVEGMNEDEVRETAIQILKIHGALESAFYGR